MHVASLPSFARVEIRLDRRDRVASAAASLRILADELDRIASENADDETAIVLAHHRIKTTSQRLRKGDEIA